MIRKLIRIIFNVASYLIDIIVDWLLGFGFWIVKSRIRSKIVAPFVCISYMIVGAIIGGKNGVDNYVIEWWNSYCKKK